MCRMFGMVASRPEASRLLLRDAPRSLQALSREHQDGWGIAIRNGDDWAVHRSTACAAECARYAELVAGLAIETRLLVAHIRRKTVGEKSIANTHPFRRGHFVFAHNGTVNDVPALVARSSAARLAEIEGDTDSERLFAFVLTHIDAVGDSERGVVAAVRELHAMGDVGSASFLLSCGARLYAHRLGRSLFTLVRHASADGAAERRAPAVLVASECPTAEAWVEIPERGLVVLDIARELAVQSLAA